MNRAGLAPLDTNAWNNPSHLGPSTVLTTKPVNGDDRDRIACPPVLGRVEVCNANYGATGWLGLAQIWIYRGSTIYANYTHTCRGTGHVDSFDSAGATSSYFPGAKASFAPGTQVAKNQYVDHLPDGGLLGHLDHSCQIDVMTLGPGRPVPASLLV